MADDNFGRDRGASESWERQDDRGRSGRDQDWGRRTQEPARSDWGREAQGRDRSFQSGEFESRNDMRTHTTQPYSRREEWNQGERGGEGMNAQRWNEDRHSQDWRSRSNFGDRGWSGAGQSYGQGYGQPHPFHQSGQGQYGQNGGQYGRNDQNWSQYGRNDQNWGQYGRNDQNWGQYGRNDQSWGHPHGQNDQGWGSSFGRDEQRFGMQNRGFPTLGTSQPRMGRGPRNYRRSDERIREEVCEAIVRAGDIDAGEVDVEVKDGEVTLSGMVEDRNDKRRIEEVAEQVSGVRDVHNHVKLKTGGIKEALSRAGEAISNAFTGGSSPTPKTDKPANGTVEKRPNG